MTDNNKYVILDDGEIRGHINHGEETLCGLGIRGEYSTGSSLGDMPLCDLCDRLDPDNDSQELIDTIGDVVAGFETRSGGPAGFLDRAQLLALTDYIVEHQDTKEIEQ